MLYYYIIVLYANPQYLVAYAGCMCLLTKPPYLCSNHHIPGSIELLQHNLSKQDRMTDMDLLYKPKTCCMAYAIHHF